MTKFVEYSLVGVDGNAFAVIGYVKDAMRKEGYTQSEIEAYTDESSSRDYYHVIATSVDMINKINSKKRES